MTGRFRPRKFDKVYNAEVLLKLCFIEFYYYNTKKGNTAAHLLCVFSSMPLVKNAAIWNVWSTFTKFP